MREDILSNLENPKQLEKLYREHRLSFKREFNNIYDAIKEHKIANYWKERLNYESGEISWGTRNELPFVIFISLLAGLLAKVPDIFGLNELPYYTRNIGFLLFPFLMIYFAWKNHVTGRNIVVAACMLVVSVVFINSLPPNHNSDTLVLACVHLPFLLWTVLGYIFIGDSTHDFKKRIDFLKYNGDLLVITALIVIAGGILTGITIGLFSLIDIKIEDFYFRYVVIFGLPIAPIMGTYLTQTNPQLVNKVSPVIARIFSPLVLITLVVYLAAILYSKKDPFNDRDFLMMFNGLLIGVMALILFSVVEAARSEKNKQNTIVLLLLSTVTIIVNAIALSAILFRISEWGITPNRLAVLGGNILILTNLLIVTVNLIKSVRNSEKIELVEKSIANYLPYIICTIPKPIAQNSNPYSV